MYKKEDVTNLQSQDIEPYFPSYKRRPWQPFDDGAASQFFKSCVEAKGPVILRDIQNAIELVHGKKFSDQELVPRSKYSPDMIRRQCQAQEEGGILGNYDSDILKRSFEKVRRMFAVPKLKPLKLEEVPYNAGTSAGLPTLLTKAKDYPRAIQEARALQLNPNKAPQPTILFHRGKNLEQARYVNGYPFAMTLLEGRFFYPYQSAVIKHHTPYAGGRYDFETAVLLNEVQCKSRFILESDYSKYDTSIPAKLTGMAFSIIQDCFDMTEEDRRDWERITRYFHTSPLLAPDGYIYSGRRHGVPSGSDFTQIVDSIVNAIIIEYCARKLNFKPTRYYVLGDDVVMGVDKPLSLKDLSATMIDLGIHLNIEKSKFHTCNEMIHFLGHDLKSMTMRRDIDETYHKMLTPERTRREYFSKNRDERRAAYIQRLRDYQEDNPDAWNELEALVQFYQASDDRRKYLVKRAKETGKWEQMLFWYYRNQWYGPTDALEINERARWDASKRDFVLGNHRGQVVFI